MAFVKLFALQANAIKTIYFCNEEIAIKKILPFKGERKYLNIRKALAKTSTNHLYWINFVQKHNLKSR